MAPFAWSAFGADGDGLRHFASGRPPQARRLLVRSTLSHVTGKRSQVSDPPAEPLASAVESPPRALIRERRSHRRWVPLVAGILTFVLGVRRIVIMLRPHVWERVRVIDRVLPAR